MKTEKISKYAQQIIDKYKNLDLGNKKVRCPYYINVKKNKDLRAMVGKGTPEEIIMEARIWEKLKGINFEKMTEEEIRSFLIERGLGIDCSGFVTHALNYWHYSKTGKNIFNELNPGYDKILRKIVYFLKPVENLGVLQLCSDKNSFPVQINDVKPGDVIRSTWKRKNSYHILIVTEVTKSDNGVVKKIKYANSTEQYGKNNGVREGEIEITDINLPLHKQNWTDVDENGINHQLEGYLFDLEKNGIRRIKAVEKLQA